MPIIPKSSKVRFVLIILFLAVIFLAFYFRAKDVRAPIVIDVPTTDDSANTSYLGGQMEDGVLFDGIIATTTETATTTVEISATTTLE